MSDTNIVYVSWHGLSEPMRIGNKLQCSDCFDWVHYSKMLTRRTSAGDIEIYDYCREHLYGGKGLDQ